jgi:threonine synthase
MKYYCYECEEIFKDVKLPRCLKCGGVYDLIYDYTSNNHIFKELSQNKAINHWRYHDFMPIKYHNIHRVLTMGEGGTPLLNVNNLKITPQSDLYFKCEFMNPTGSFKDRASALEVTLALNYAEIVVATTGNMGASLAAYSALAGKKLIVFIPEGIHNSKIDQIQMYGTIINYVKGDYTDAMIAAEQYHLEHPHSYLAGDYGVRIEGTKSIGFEICEQLEWSVPNYIVVPVGNGTLLYAIHKAFDDLYALDIIAHIPKIIGVKAEDPKNTIASAIACPKPSLDYIISEYTYKIMTVSDEEIMSSRQILAKNGFFVEPAGAAAYAGLQKLNIEGTIITLLTGHGLKGI